MLEIAKRSPRRYTNVRLLPPFASDMTETHLEALLYFGETLQELDLSYQDHNAHYFSRLVVNFSNLRKLELAVYSQDGDLAKLDKLLTQCPHLETLELSWDSADIMETDALQSWVENNDVQRSNKMCGLYLLGLGVPHVVDYLLYKYPYTTAVMLNFPCLNHEGNINAEHYLNATEDINYVHLTDWPIDDMNTLERLVESVKSERNRLCLAKGDLWSDGLASAVIDRNSPRGFSEFEVTTHSDDLSLSRLVGLIGNVVELDITYSDFVDDPADLKEPKSHLYTLLATLPVIEYLKLTDANIQHRPALVNDLVLPNLTDIHICAAIIDPDVLPTLEKMAPQLKRLTLDTCILDVKCYQDHHIRLLGTSLDTLSILATEYYWHRNESEDEERSEAYTWMKKSLMVESYQLVFLHVSTLSSRSKHTQYFVLKPGTPSQCKRITVDVFEGNAGKWPRMTIHCKSLKLLKIELGALVININLDVETMIESLGDWQMEKQDALAVHLRNM